MEQQLYLSLVSVVSVYGKGDLGPEHDFDKFGTRTKSFKQYLENIGTDTTALFSVFLELLVKINKYLI